VTGDVTPAAGAGALLATAKTAATSAACTAVVNSVTITVQVARDLTVAVGDVLIVIRVGSQWFAIGRAYAAAPLNPNNDEAPNPGAGNVSGTLVVPAVSTGTYRSSKWRTDAGSQVIQGDWSGSGNNTGAVFYGTKARSLSGATVTSASAQIRRISGGWNYAVPTTLRLVTEATRPAGAPTLTSTTTGPSLAVGTTTTFTVPTAWAQAMVDGTAGGLGFLSTADSDHYAKFAGTNEWAAAFTLSINWRR
jgi:hypothetical protein